MEKRFAIIIGINDYNDAPLSYCVNDGDALKGVLISKANFKEENIYPILSSGENPIKDITGTLLNAILKISEFFTPNEDSIFFYFAGHGVSADNKSNLVFHDSNFAIKLVFEKLNELKPKMQYYVIDACESGGKTLARKTNHGIQKINFDEYVSASSGIMFLYACQSTELAFEIESEKHGILTYYFIEAINKSDLYDEDGVLTPGRIQEYVSKNVSKKSKFTQIPVVESRITGYYPFASQIEHSEMEEHEEIHMAEKGKLNRSKIENITYDRESRLKLQIEAFKKNQELNIEKLEPYVKDFEINTYNSIDEIPLKNSSSLSSEIVNDAHSKLKSINSTIYYKKIPIYEKSGSLQLSIAAMMGERPIKGYSDDPFIDFNSEYISSEINIVGSKSIEIVSFGFGSIIYQAKWGMVLSPFCFLIDWDGEKDCLITDIKKENYSFLINIDAFERVKNLELNVYDSLDSQVDSWNKKRAEELENFEIRKS